MRTKAALRNAASVIRDESLYKKNIISDEMAQDQGPNIPGFIINNRACNAVCEGAEEVSDAPLPVDR